MTGIPAVKALLLAAVVLPVGVAGEPAPAAAAGDARLEGAVEELRSLVEEQRRRIRALQDAEAQESGRRMADTAAQLAGKTPSIHGDLPGTRKYNDQEDINGALDHLWLIICGALVMFMQAGFAMVEAGCCRFKNVQNVLLKNLMDVCIGTVGWYIFGWSFAYSGPLDANGDLENKFAGSLQFAGHHFNVARADGQIEPTTANVNFFFQWAFCSAAATIVSGGVAERVNFPGYAVFSFLMTGFIYPCVVAWTWGYGFLHSMNGVGAFDFAGSGIVHMTGGVGALVGAFVAGPRTGRWARKDGREQSLMERVTRTPESFDPHSMIMIVLGTFILWFGWYGFNCGSTLAMHTMEKGMLAAQVAMNTTIAASTSGLMVLLIRFDMTGKFDVGGMCNGILSGLVSITAGCSNMENASAFGTGVVASIVYVATSTLLRVGRIDDPVDAFAVHGANGAWGVVAAAIFDWGQAFNYVHGWEGFRCVTGDDGKCKEGLGSDIIIAAVAEVAMIFTWVGGLCLILFAILRKSKLLVASADMQEEGFDLLKHSPQKAYALEKSMGRTVI